MPIVSRVSLPEEFYDITSNQILIQPEPSYIFADLAMAALLADLDVPDMLGLQLAGRQIGPGAGADYSTAERDRFAALQQGKRLLSDIFAVAIDFSGLPGSTVRFNRPLFADTTYTDTSRAIAANSSISTVPIAAGSEQLSATLFRYGGPYDQTNSRVAPFGIDAMDARMGVHKLAKFVGTQLRRDYHKFIDKQYVTLGESMTALYPRGFAADNDIATTGAAPMDYATIARAERLLDEANCPYFPGTGRRLLVITPQQAEEVKNDAQFARYAEFHRDLNPVFPEYLATCGKFDIMRSNTLNKVNNGSSVPVNRALALGPNAFGIGMGRPVSVRPASDDNYGETAKVIWLGDMAFKMMDNRLGLSVRTG